MSNSEYEMQSREGSSQENEGGSDPETSGSGAMDPSDSLRMSPPDSKARRRFINTMIGGGLLGWLGSLFYPVMSFLKPPDVPEANINSVRAGLASAFQNNTSEIVKFGRTPVLLIRLATGEFRAFAATCTHLDCIVQYRSDIAHIWCACHNGHYDLNGRNLSGPPPMPLPAFSVNVVNDEIMVSKLAQVI